MWGRFSNPHRIADKLFYGTLVLLVLVLGSMGALLTHQRVGDVSRRLDRRIDTTVRYLESVLPHEVARLHAKNIRQAIENAAADELEAVEIFDSNGNRLYIYERTGQSGVFYERSDTRELMYDGEKVGKFVAYFSKRESMGLLRRRELLRFVILIAAAGLALGAGITILVKRFVVTPIERTRDFSTELAAGRYDRRIVITAQDEMGMLQQSLNHMAESLQHSVERLLEASRLKSEFLANLSHEIRTPMNAVIGFADVLLDDEPKEERRESLATIKRSAAILLETIDHILDFSKIKSGELKLLPTTFPLAEVVAEITPLVRQKLSGKEVTLSVELAPDHDGVVCCDRLRLRQVLLNLLINATKFTVRGQIRFVAHAPVNGSTLIEISDTGIGIPKEEHERVFEPFTQVDASHTRQYSGTGLGLAISKQLVELMGGRIWLASEPGQGTTVSFTIPHQAEVV